ncbi:DUF4129 domain-containing protein [Phytoactinopolyspora alkaliphila]|uniref:DUF4129 domain-containing protein n=1 Tax=Phytoactinopolyspora alkaliphila TaxID=1783498 RepID=A0A6N9YR69_9ACTN|nr:DUF4129 domain-containing protein [Phytoactinopolyspora alkaliphila]NED97299.1 DUF4129 domain-containing protein [Phytoactinopolyspora alkaliphila]
MIRHSTPIELDRDEARDLAREELSRPGYETEVSLPARILEWILEQFERLISGAADTIPGGLGTVVMLALLAAAIILLVVRTGPMARRRRRFEPVFSETPRTAAEHRSAAENAARAGEWNTAVVERFRAVVTGLRERGVVDVRSSRTADEVARLAAARLPQLAAQLDHGARTFDQVLYGDRSATQADDDALRELDEAVRSARPQHTAAEPAMPAVPR